MNIFVLDPDAEQIPRQTADQHLNKMILESAQMLCTALWVSGSEAQYKATHVSHPCSKWVRESLSNWIWLRDHALRLEDERQHRFGPKPMHKSAILVNSLNEPNIKDIGLTSFCMAMPEEYKGQDVVE